MRQEAKHYLLKKYANVTANRINLPYSLAIRHQLVQSDYFLRKNAFSRPFVTCANYQSKFLIVEKMCYENVKYESLKHVYIGKTKFEIDTIVLLKVENEIPQFGKIFKLIKTKKQLAL